ncbi:hypothetical protein VTN77DRAFT_8739 [Rasamsonia byssochlamydoides]|uniref:uncharacterized protein n=1 Tax=Rasamsonia byssochlamydoides TaxID=89139 RepID=UPI003743EB79
MSANSSPFDPYACASLHNQIISLIASTATQQYNNRIVHNFFVAYGDDAAAVRGRLSPPLITFLENIVVVSNNENEDNDDQVINFTPHLEMPNPKTFFDGALGGVPNWYGEVHENWVVLYRATEANHGIYFDMDTNLCTWQEEMTPWLHNWYPLQQALQLWLSLYQSGKFQPSIGQEAIYDPAYHSRYIPTDLDRDLQAYHALLAAIQTRIPNSSISGEPGLVDEATLDGFRISGFLRDFLLQARRPSFEYVAPGLRLPTTAWLQEILSRDHGSERYTTVRDEGLVLQDDDERWHPNWMQEESSNHIGERYLVEKTSGLYSWPDAISEDAVRLVLPYPIGANGWVRDGNPDAVTDENRDNVPDDLVNNDALYQHGWCPFLPRHGPRLSTVLNNWRRLVEEGKWSVGPNGVEGGIDVFRQADTEEHGRSYRIGVCFDEHAS